MVVKTEMYVLRKVLLILMGGVLLLPLLGPSSPAYAASITVDTTADERNENGKCSLREAIINVNQGDQSGSVDCPAGSGGDTIVLPAGTYTLTLSGSQEDQSKTGDFDIRAAMTIRGSGPKNTIIRAENLGDRVLHIHEGATVTIQGVSITNGKAPGGADGADGADGGGVYNQGSLTFMDSVISDNIAGAGGYGPAQAGYGGRGGGIYNLRGSLTLINTLVSNNQAGQGGASRGTSGNGGNGGGIANNAGTVTIINSTISGNTAGPGSCHTDGCITGGDGGSGGGVMTRGGTVELFHATISNNRTGNGGNGRTTGGDGGGGGVANESGTVTINHTIVAGNYIGTDTTISGTGPDCSGKLQSQDYNLFGNVGGCTVEGQTSNTIVSTTPKLSPLGDQGGESQTHALLPGSPAIDAGNAAFNGKVKTVPLTADQRGKGYQRVVNGRVDIGAFEASPEIGVFFYAQNLTTKPLVEFGTAPRGTPIQYVFTVTNTYNQNQPGSGTADLAFTVPITLPRGFSLIGDFPLTVPVNQSRSFTLQLDADEVGSFEGTVGIANNDNDESLFTFKVTGHVANGPEIEIWADGRNIKSTSEISEEYVVEFPFGVTGRGPVEKIFTIKNVGNEDLTIEPNRSESPAGFNVMVSQLPPRVPAGSSRDFVVSLITTSPGTFEGAVRIYNNDVDENPFTFFVRGNVLKSEEVRTVHLPIVIR